MLLFMRYSSLWETPSFMGYTSFYRVYLSLGAHLSVYETCLSMGCASLQGSSLCLWVMHLSIGPWDMPLSVGYAFLHKSTVYASLFGI